MDPDELLDDRRASDALERWLLEEGSPDLTPLRFTPLAVHASADALYTLTPVEVRPDETGAFSVSLAPGRYQVYGERVGLLTIEAPATAEAAFSALVTPRP